MSNNRLSHCPAVSETVLVSSSDPFALGHYPGNPIYPGVLLLEHMTALAQRLASACLGKTATVNKIRRIQYLEAVLPGDAVSLHAEFRSVRDGEAELAVMAAVRGKLNVRATLSCTTAPRQTAEPDVTTTAEPIMSHRDLGRILPHRYPFLLVDAVQAYKTGSHITATRIVGRNLPMLMSNTFPDVYPPGLAIESLGQAGIALFLLSHGALKAPDIVLGSMNNVEYLADIPFDTVLSLEARIDRQLPQAVVLSGKISVGSTPVISIGSLVAMIDPRSFPTETLIEKTCELG